jgi:hypothetical protein
MPAARSGLRSPQSDASYASRRIAANLRLIVDGAYGRCSSAIRYRVTTVLLKASLGSEQYQSMNSRIAWSYERFELEDVRLFKTADFDCSKSGNLRTVFGTRLRLLFAIGSGLRCRGEKHDPVPDLLTSSAFPSTELVKLPTSRLRGRSTMKFKRRLSTTHSAPPINHKVSDGQALFAAALHSESFFSNSLILCSFRCFSSCKPVPHENWHGYLVCASRAHFRAMV